jgi:uncharacterized protein (TIGR02145 family)
VSLIADPADITGMTSIFADRPDMLTSLYQFNRKKAWSPAGTVVDYPTTYPPEGDWAAENSPCPESWRIPTKEEFELLATFNRRWVLAGVVGNAIAGMFVGDNADTATILDPKGCIFFPELLYRNGIGNIDTGDKGAFYWPSNEYSDPSYGWYVRIRDTSPNSNIVMNVNSKLNASGIRPVKIDS